MAQIEVERTYLQLTDPGQLRPARRTDTAWRLDRVDECPASFFRYLYAEVGRAHHWMDRSGWSDEQVRARLDRPGVSLWVLSLGGAPAGYFELERHDDGSVEIAYFGLLPEFKRRGLGKHLLTLAAEEAWRAGARRVWLHTCTLDDPAALPNYLERGFEPFRKETYFTENS